MDKIVVVTSNPRQFRDWIGQNIIPVYSEQGIRNLLGVHIKEIHFAGTSYKEWFHNQESDYLKELLFQSRC